MKILFMGETAEGSAEYLRDCLLFYKHKVTHIQSNEKINSLIDLYDIIIISDYPAKNINNQISQEIVKQVNNGARFIMLGGWSSFNGLGNNYYAHPLSKILPVNLNKTDDRNNVPQGLILSPDKKLTRKINLDWSTPPIICGYNKTHPKKNSTVLVWIRPINSNGIVIKLSQPIPLLVKQKYGLGISIAFMTDVAPHWCGGLVDWGKKRIKLKHVEIGDMFLKFIKFLLEV